MPQFGFGGLPPHSNSEEPHDVFTAKEWEPITATYDGASPLIIVPVALAGDPEL
jgi:hypothetical protein